MQFTISQAQLNSALQKVAKAQPKKATTIDVLHGVMITAHDSGQVELVVTNLSTSIRTFVSAEVKEAGQVCVPVAQLAELAGAARKAEAITLSSEGQNLRFRSGGAKLLLNGYATEMYPLVPTMNGDGTPLPADYLSDLAEMVAPFADSADDGRAVLQCVMITVRGGKAAAFAADGYKSALLERDLDIPDQVILIDAEALRVQIVPALSGDQIKMVTSDRNVIFSDGTTEVVAQYIDANPVDHTRIIPSNVATAINLDTQDVFKALSILAPVLDQGNKRVTFNASLGTVTLTAASQRGEGADSFVVDQAGDDAEFLVNPEFVKLALGIAGKKAQLRDAGGMSPLLISSPSRPGWLSLLMKMHAEKKAEE